MKRFSSLLLTLLLLLCTVPVSGQPMGSSRLTYPGELWSGEFATADTLIARAASVGATRAVITSSLACTTKPCTFPATLTLDFRGGNLNCQSTVNAFVVLGNILPTKKQIFTGCGSASNVPLISFAGNVHMAEIPTAWFGDTGVNVDGVVNVSPFVRDTLLAASTLTNGGTVRMGPGNHNFTSSLFLYGNNITLAGSPGTVVDVNVGVMWQTTNAAGWGSSGFTIRDIKFVVHGAFFAISVGGNAVQRLTVENIECDLTLAGTGATCLTGTAISSAHVRHNLFYGAGNGIGKAVNITGGGVEIEVEDNRCEYLNACIQLAVATGREYAHASISHNTIDFGWWLQKAVVSSTAETFSYSSPALILTDATQNFPVSPTYNSRFVRMLPVRQAVTSAVLYDNNLNKIVDTNAQFRQKVDAAGSITSGANIVTLGTSYAISAISRTSNTVTATTATHPFSTGDVVTVAGVTSHHLFEGQYLITVTNNTHFTYSQLFTNATISGDGATATVTTVLATPIQAGDVVAIAGYTGGNSGFNNASATVVSATPATRQFTYANATVSSTTGGTTAFANDSGSAGTAAYGFRSADVGKMLSITGAGPAGATLMAPITVVTDATTATIATNASTTVTGTGTVTWGGVNRGDIVRSPTVTPTKWAVVHMIVSDQELQIEPWRDWTTYRPTAVPADGTTATVYGLLRGIVESYTATTLRLSGGVGDYWANQTLLPPDGLLYEVLPARLSYPIQVDAGESYMSINYNTIRRSDSDSIGAQSGTHLDISHNDISEGQDIGITANGEYATITNNKIRHQGSTAIWASGDYQIVSQNEVSESDWLSLTAIGRNGGIWVRKPGITVTDNMITKGAVAAADVKGMIFDIVGTTDCYVAGNRTLGFDASHPGLYIKDSTTLAGTTFAKNFFGTYSFGTSITGGLFLDTGSFAFADLPYFAENGSHLYCSDCLVQATCAATGTGAFAKRLAGAWVCN